MPYAGIRLTVRIARQITEFCPIWTSAKAAPVPLERAVGEHPHRDRKSTPVPDLAIVVRSRVQPHNRSIVVLPRRAAPAPVAPPPSDLSPSDGIVRPKSLRAAKLEQNSGRAWSSAPNQPVWDKKILKIAEKSQQEYDVRQTKHRIWRRETEQRRSCGLGRPSIQQVSWDPQKRDVSRFEAPHRAPELAPREIPAPIGSEPIRTTARLITSNSLNTWVPTRPPQSSVEPLKFLGPGFAISIPEPSPLR